MLGDQLSAELLDRMNRLGNVLGVVPDSLTLWVSFMTYLLILVAVRSGLPEQRFPILAQNELRMCLTLPEGLWKTWSGWRMIWANLVEVHMMLTPMTTCSSIENVYVVYLCTVVTKGSDRGVRQR